MGGQALVDGVMIRQGSLWAAASRNDLGHIVTTSSALVPSLRSGRSIPIVRGMGALVDSFRVATAAMRWSRTTAQRRPTPKHQGVVVALVVSAVCAAFLLVPIGVARGVTGLGTASWVEPIIEGFVRLVMFVGYLAGVSRLPGLRSTFAYHGAEHMVVSAFERGSALDIAAVRRCSTRHPRCGTDFFLVIFMVSIVVFALVGHLPVVVLVASRLLLAPIVVGISFEVLRVGGGHHGRWSSALSAPGLWMQRFTTAEPDDEQIEVAVAALHTLLGVQAQLVPESCRPELSIYL